MRRGRGIQGCGSNGRHRSVHYRDMVKGATKDAKDLWRVQYQKRFKFVQAKMTPDLARISVEAEGVAPSLDYRVQFYATDDSDHKRPISPWHDIPLQNADGTYNLIVEVPKWTRHKFEICTTETMNPIKQDVKNGKPRDYAWGDMPFNYGAFPQTWEDPRHLVPETGCVGDNDPLDVIDIGTKQWAVGSVVRVKVLGIVALIDDGETDWKVITISAEVSLVLLALCLRQKTPFLGNPRIVPCLPQPMVCFCVLLFSCCRTSSPTISTTFRMSRRSFPELPSPSSIG